MFQAIVDATKTVVQAVLPWWERKQKLHVLGADLAVSVAKFRLDRMRMAETATEERLKLAAKWYPLGFPGRVRAALIGVSELVPRVVVASAGDTFGTEICARIEELLHELDETGRFLHLVSGALVAESGRSVLRGIVVREVAIAEFDPAPSLIVVAEGDQHTMRLRAHMSGFVPDLDNVGRLDLPLVRLWAGTAQIAWVADSGGELRHEWHALPEDAPRAEVVSYAAVAMILAFVQIYWATQGVRWRLSESAHSPFRVLLEQDVETTAEYSAVHRLLHEIEVLEDKYGQVGVFRAGTDALTLLVHGNPNVVLEITESYPAAPPLVWVGTSEPALIAIPASEWSSARSLAEVVEGALDAQAG